MGGSQNGFSGSQATLARTMFLELSFPGRRSGLVVERAGSPRPRPLDDMEVDHGRFDAGVAHEVLDGADVGAVLE